MGKIYTGIANGWGGRKGRRRVTASVRTEKKAKNEREEEE